MDRLGVLSIIRRAEMFGLDIDRKELKKFLRRKRIYNVPSYIRQVSQFILYDEAVEMVKNMRKGVTLRQAQEIVSGIKPVKYLYGSIPVYRKDEVFRKAKGLVLG